MPEVSSAFFQKKGERKVVRLGLEDNEHILGCIRACMKEHGLEECDVLAVKGKVKEGQLAYFQGNSYRAKALQDREIERASGKFRLIEGKAIGDLHVTVSWGNNRIVGTLVKGKAIGEMEIELGFVSIPEC